MSTPGASHGTPGRVGERALARGVTATWWYTVSGVVFFGVVSVSQWFVWMLIAHDAGGLGGRLVLAAGAALIGLASVVMLLGAYRPHVLSEDGSQRRHVPRAEGAWIGVGVVSALPFGVATGSWLAGVGVVAFVISVRPWMHGVRWRVILGMTVVLVALWFAEARWWPAPEADGPVYLVPALFAVLLPLTAASSLWWWDIVLELDRARQAESQLAATRERLRLANDVHDLQGHHLQVIALQLELAQRLMSRDPAAASAELARARAAVDDARQGTRDLAAAFRGVPLPDELENAADLLRSAGLEVDARVDPDAADAPSDVLGPIVRESVTNVLRHGDGRWARLSLARDGRRWVYRIANDDAGDIEAGGGSGVAGMTARAEEAGGDVRVSRGSDVFELTVTLPTAPGAALAGVTGADR
jgi:two-component system sensor histidine kinase DesK